MMTGKAMLAGVLGDPVSHSLSPQLHNYWLKEYNIDGAYVPLAVKPEHLHSALRALSQMGFRGCNLTIPHKEAAMHIVDFRDEIATAIGAINTIEIEDGKLLGSNSDAYGFIGYLRAQVTDLPKYLEHVVVVGAGGASRAIVYALWKEGAKKISLINRTRERANTLAVHYKTAPITPLGWEHLPETMRTATLLVNTTSLGLKGEGEAIALGTLPREALVTDIVYNPLITPLLAEAKTLGNRVVDGLGMLLHQAVPGFESWFGKKPQVTEALRNHIISSLG